HRRHRPRSLEQLGRLRLEALEQAFLLLLLQLELLDFLERLLVVVLLGGEPGLPGLEQARAAVDLLLQVAEVAAQAMALAEDRRDRDGHGVAPDVPLIKEKSPPVATGGPELAFQSAIFNLQSSILRASAF